MACGAIFNKGILSICSSCASRLSMLFALSTVTFTYPLTLNLGNKKGTFYLFMCDVSIMPSFVLVTLR